VSLSRLLAEVRRFRSSRAQSSGKIWRIGFIAHRYEIFYDPLFQGLRELGYTEGQNLIVERRE
jgi:putative tryptophan/tyrosine transport system substrate-binding protein